VLRALLAKDLRRAWRNPLPWLLNIALPVLLTAVIGMVFGSQTGKDNSLGRIKFAFVDEDKSALTGFLRGAASQGKAGEYLEPVFLERDAAEQQLKDDKLSAILVVPAYFTSNYLTGQKVRLELIKNPAEQIHPAVLEELLGVVASALNAISRNFASQFPAWRELVEGNGDYHDLARLIEQTGNKFQAARKYLFPPLVGYTNTAPQAVPAAGADPKVAASTSGAEAKPAQQYNLLAFLLVGLSAMFLLLIANQGMADLHREVWKHTFERYNTMHQRLLPFVAGKALFTVVIVSIGAAIMLAGGQWLFHFRWPRPFDLGLLTLAYVFFCSGFMAVTVAITPDEHRANALNSVLSMAFSIAGGCMFPPEHLPAAVRHLSPLMPTYWFATTARDLWWSDASWVVPAAKLAVLGALCVALAAFLFKRRFEKGLR
jgi:ABC-type multidrug transport system permease subunit